MTIFLLHPLLNILFFAIPLALFEISIEKAHGWGSGWSKDKWYAKSSLKGTKFDNLISKITKLEPPLNYHLIVSYILFPLIFIMEYIYGYRNIFLIIGSLFAVLVFAELTWFSCNWYFHSWTELTKGPNGSIFWHKDWVNIYKNKYLPKAYFIWTFLMFVFLLLAYLFH